tara:strand:+ start:89 stop:736 length:648 start_codon:yes stop_codon:yes gene_type:complete
MKNKIIILGKSIKFIKIVKNIYKKDIIQIISWRNIHIIKKKQLIKKPNIIFVCGYDYESHWYSFKKFYDKNIKFPHQFIKFISKEKTKIIYIDTMENLNNKKKSKKITLSRYEYAKKMLRYKLIKNFKYINVIEFPPIINKNQEPMIYGGAITKKIFKFLINYKLVDSISVNKLKKKLYVEKNFIRTSTVSYPKKLLLEIPRPLFVDRFLRIISD